MRVSNRRRLCLLIVLINAATWTSCTTSSPSDGDGGSPAPHLERVFVSPSPRRWTRASRSSWDRRSTSPRSTGRIVLSTEDDIFTANADGTGLHPVTRRRSRVRPGVGSRRRTDRVSGLATWHQPGRRDLRRTCRRHGREEPDPGPGERLGAGLVPGRPDDRVQLRPRRAAHGGVPRGPRRIPPPSDCDGRVRRVPGLVAGRNPDRVHGREERAPSTTSGWWTWTASNLIQLTYSPGSDGWPAWSPDGTGSRSPRCGTTAPTRMPPTVVPPETSVRITTSGCERRRDRLSRVTPEFGQFVTWSPDGH